MGVGEPTEQEWQAALHPELTPYVRRIHGYRVSGMDPGVHIGMPSPTLTMIVSLSDPLVVQAPGRKPQGFHAMVGGLHSRPVHILHDGHQHGIQLDLTPTGARTLLGRPAADLTGELVDLSELLADDGRQLAERTGSCRGWSDQINHVQATLLRRLDSASGRSARPEVLHAWELIRGSGGTVPVWAVAAEVGWSTRHLGEQFRTEYGYGPKTAARVARFDRSRLMLAARKPLAEVATACGYADQAHLNRDWRQFAGTSPTRWESVDQLAFFQDDGA